MLGGEKGKGYGRALMEYCLSDARAKGKSGVCMLGAAKQKAWLSDQSFAQKFGFEAVDTTDYAIPCWPGPLTGRPPGSRPRPRSQWWRGRS